MEINNNKINSKSKKEILIDNNERKFEQEKEEEIIKTEKEDKIKIKIENSIGSLVNKIKSGISQANKDERNEVRKDKKIQYDNGEYYIGEVYNNIPKGKGIVYYKNVKIKYDGDFINGKKEGNRKLIKENGNYFIGSFNNGLRHGKGMSIIINNKREGHGKIYL